MVTIAGAVVAGASTARQSGASRHKKNKRRQRISPAIAAPPPSPPHDASVQRILELLPCAIMLVDRQGRIGFANTAAAALFGYDPGVLVGAALDSLIPSLAGADLQQSSVSLLPATETRSNTIARRKNGTEFPVAVATATYRTGPGSETLITASDLTDQSELIENRKALAHLTRVSTLGQLAGSLAHELNQPLTAILSNAQAARRVMSATPLDAVEMREILDDLVKDNHRANEVLRKIRLLVKQEEPETAAINLADVADDVALLVHSDAIVRGVRLALDIAPTLPLVSGDKVQLQQVVLNLVLNAFEAVATCPKQDRMVTIEAGRTDDGMIRLAVRDRGHGFTRDALSRLFQPYNTSKRDGLGLGLCISRSIVESHGGRIWVECNSHQGATVCFTLPSTAPGSSRT